MDLRGQQQTNKVVIIQNRVTRIEPVRRAKRSLGGTSILTTEKSSMIPYVRLHLHVVIICRNANITCDTASSCDKVSFVDVFSPCLVSGQYKQSERSTTRTKNRGSLKVLNWIVERHVGFLRNIVEISSSKMNYYRPRSKNSPF